jgi:antidote-toxin recognition MazE-like antitoxin
MATKFHSTRAGTRRTKTARIRTARIKTPRSKSTVTKKLADQKSSRDKVRTYRKRMRAKGLRLVQIWVPNTKNEFSAESIEPEGGAWAQAMTVPPREEPLTFKDIADLVGSVDGPFIDMRRKKQYLQATGYGRKRHR